MAINWNSVESMNYRWPNCDDAPFLSRNSNFFANIHRTACKADSCNYRVTVNHLCSSFCYRLIVLALWSKTFYLFRSSLYRCRLTKFQQVMSKLSFHQPTSLYFATFPPPHTNLLRAPPSSAFDRILFRFFVILLLLLHLWKKKTFPTFHTNRPKVSEDSISHWIFV